MASNNVNREKYPDLLSDLADQASEELLATGMKPEQAADVGFRIAERVRQAWQGHHIYMPKAMAFELSKRDLEIWTKFNGRNIHLLADEYNLTEMRIYQIIKMVRAQQTKRLQPDLFKEKEGTES